MYVCHESTVSLWWLPGLIQRCVKLHSPLGFQVVILILFGFSLKFASLGSSSLIISQAKLGPSFIIVPFCILCILVIIYW